MNNVEANAALVTRQGEIYVLETALSTAIQRLLDYEREMGDWKDSVIASKITEIQTEATKAGVDFSTWDGSKA